MITTVPKKLILSGMALLLCVFNSHAIATETTRVNLEAKGAQVFGDCTYESSISANGRYVVFASDARFKGDTNGQRDSFVHDCLTKRLVRLSVNYVGGLAPYDRITYSSSISADGRYTT
jgi:Tol biopolymer transport system component